MATPQYRGSARSKGFRSINMQNSAPQRILQEASRVANGMREQQEAVLADRKTQSQAMETNFKIEQRQRDNNFETLQKNLGVEQQEALGRIKEQSNQTAAMYKNLETLSVTAAKGVMQFEQARQKAQKETDINEFLTNPEYRQLVLDRHEANLLENAAAVTEANANAIGTEMLGARSVETGRVLNAFKGLSAGHKLAIVDQKFRGFPAELEAELSGDREFYDPQTGTMFKGEAARSNERLHGIVSQIVLDDFLQKNGFNELSTEFIGPGLETARKYMVKSQAEAAKYEEKLDKSNTIAEFTQDGHLLNDPVAVKAHVESNYQALIRAHDYDVTKANEQIVEMLYARDVDGNYLISEDSRQAGLDSVIGPNGERVRDYKKLNADAKRAARIDRKKAFDEDRDNRQLDGEAFFADKMEDLQSIFEKGNPADDQQAINTFEAEYREEFGYDIPLPKGYVAMTKQVKNENKQEEEDLLEQAQLGNVDLTLSQAMSITDDTTRDAAVKLVREKENVEYGGDYASLNKSLKGFAKQLVDEDLASEGMAPMAELLVPELEADFKKYYDEEIARLTADGNLEVTAADYAVARQNALQKLQQDVANGKGDVEGAKYARKKDTQNNLYEFPNLNLEERRVVARQRYNTAIQSYGKRGDKVFDSRGVVLADSQLLKLSDTYTRTGVLDIPPVVMKLSQISGELPIDIINRQGAASGLEAWEPIQPPSYYNNLKGQNPEVVALFHGATSVRQRARALSQLPDQIQKRLETTDFEYLTNSIAGVESTSYGSYDAYNLGGSDNGHTAHGSGNSAKDNRFGKPISQLTISDIRRLHNSGQLFATGRYQFIPMTFSEVTRALNLPDDTVFDKSVQDVYFLTRLKQRARMSAAAGIPLEEGLRMEWIGLQNMTEQEYQRVVDVAKSILSNN